MKRVFVSSAVLALGLGLGLGPTPVGAASRDTSPGRTPDWAKAGRNDLSLFLGGASSAGERGFSFGLDYERRLGRRFGIGGLVEYTRVPFREGIAAVTLNWHPSSALKVFTAPGVQVEEDDGVDLFLFRLGAEYGFDLGKGFGVAPSLYLDFTSDETTVVVGVSFDKRF